MKKFLKSILCLSFGALVFVALAFSFNCTSVTILNKTTVEGLSFFDWIDFINNGQFIDGIDWWKASEILYIIFMSLIAVALILVILKLFINNKYLNLATKLASALSILALIVATLTNVIGMIVLSDKVSLISYYPHLGSCIMLVAGILAGIFGVLCANEKKRKKR